MKLRKQFPLVSALLGAALVLVVAQGCSDSGNDNVAPPDVNGGNNGTGGSKAHGGSAGNTTGNIGNSGGGDEGGAPSNPGSGGKGGTSSSNDAGTGNEGGGDNPPIPACDQPEKGVDGCFNCPQDKQLEQWLNRCVESDCVPFDNKARLPKLKADGSVPPLPV
jgi:hypothetical protein